MKILLQYGGEDGIDRDEFGVLLGNIDGFGNVAMGGARVRPTDADCASGCLCAKIDQKINCTDTRAYTRVCRYRGERPRPLLPLAPSTVHNWITMKHENAVTV